MDPVEGFYLADAYGNIFAVKGMVHPERRYIVVPRYVPSREGDRESSGTRYEKIPSSKYKLSFDKWPQLRYVDRYLGLELLAISESKVEKTYDPTARLEQLRHGAFTALQEACVSLAERLEERGVETESIGVSGSILVGLEKESSDMDLVVYGYANAKKTVEAMRRLRVEGHTTPLEGTIQNPMGIPGEIHLAHEKRKVLKGMILVKERPFRYLLRCMPLKSQYREKYGEVRHRDRGSIEGEAVVVDDQLGSTVPTVYSVNMLKPLTMQTDIISYGGIICEQVRRGERVLLSGKVEEKISQQTGEMSSEVVIDMGGHYLYSPELEKEKLPG